MGNFFLLLNHVWERRRDGPRYRYVCIPNSPIFRSLGLVAFRRVVTFMYDDILVLADPGEDRNRSRVLRQASQRGVGVQSKNLLLESKDMKRIGSCARKLQSPSFTRLDVLTSCSVFIFTTSLPPQHAVLIQSRLSPVYCIKIVYSNLSGILHQCRADVNSFVVKSIPTSAAPTCVSKSCNVGDFAILIPLRQHFTLSVGQPISLKMDHHHPLSDSIPDTLDLRNKLAAALRKVFPSVSGELNASQDKSEAVTLGRVKDRLHDTEETPEAPYAKQQRRSLHKSRQQDFYPPPCWVPRYENFGQQIFWQFKTKDFKSEHGYSTHSRHLIGHDKTLVEPVERYYPLPRPLPKAMPGGDATPRPYLMEDFWWMGGKT